MPADWTWTQHYNPTGSEPLSFLLAAAPILVLMGLLGLRHWPAHRAAVAGLITALLLAVVVYGMPVSAALAATGFGAAYGLLPIGWIILAAVFLFSLTVETGHFEIIKASVAALSPDRRVQALLVAFCFGAFVEGCAGFGAPVAITSALLIGAGFPPLQAAGLSLLANTAPVAFGSLGIPITMLSSVTDIPQVKLGMMAGRQLPLFSLIIPAWMVWVMSGWRGVKGVWPALAVCGGTFALAQFLVSNYLGPQLVDVIAGLLSIVALSLMLRLWQPRQIWRFENEPPTPPLQRYSRASVASAWMPWLILSVCVAVWSAPAVKQQLDRVGTISFKIPGLDQRIYKDVPAVPVKEKPEDAVYKLSLLSATGSGVWLAGIISALWLRVAPGVFLTVLLGTFRRLLIPLLTIACMLAIAFLTRFSGADVTLGLAFTHTGVLYPFFAAILGWMGVALTGSDTSSNALFGSMQKFTAERLGLNPILICTANSTGGVMGKMIDAQSIVVSAAATGQAGHESAILRYVFWHSVALACLMGLLTLLQAYVLTWMVPV